MIKITTSLLLTFCATLSFAQNKISIEDLIAGKYREKTLQQAQWRGESDQCTWLDNDVLMISDAKASKPKEFLSLVELNKIANKQWASFPQYKWIGVDTIVFTANNEYCRYIVKNKKIDSCLQLDVRAQNIVANSHFEFAYTIDNNLYLAARGLNSALTNYKEGIVVADEINRKEFNTNKGVFWSPSGNLLAFMEKDVRRDDQYPLVDYSSQPAKLKTAWYPFAGGKNEIVRIGVYNLTTKTTKYINTGKVDQYLTNVVWNTNEQSISVVVLNREQNKLSVRQYSVETGEQQAVLLEEKSDKYVEPEHGIMPIPKRDGEFLWLSERNGYNHLYHYTADGQLLSQVTNGNWEITRIIGFNTLGDVVYFEGTTEANPIDRHIYRANIYSLDVKCLTSSVAGWHQGVVNPSLNLVLDYSQSLSNVGTLSVIDAKQVTKPIKQAESLFQDIVLAKNRIFTLKSVDGKTDLYASLIVPPDFDSTKKYPVILDVYGGPHLQIVVNDWLMGGNMLPYLFAERGYVVLSLDNRGSAGRGLAFEQQSWRQLGTVETEDQMLGYEWLTKQSYIDTARIATYGWSFGGFMSLNLLTTFPAKFACGIAGSPVTNWQFYEIMYTERYMGTPTNNAAGYAKANLVPRAKNLKAPVYIINGALDHVTLPQNSMMFMSECIENNIDFDYMQYPQQEHNIKGYDAIHHLNKMLRFYDRHLMNKK